MGVAQMPAPYRAAVTRAEAECRSFFGGGLRSLALFGSVARGDPRPTSDVDLLAIVDDAPASGHARAALLYPLIRRVETAPEFLPLRSEGRVASLSLVLRTVRELDPTPWLLLDLVEDAVLLVDDGTLAAKLDALRRRMRELGSRRVRLPDRSWYWDLKPDLRVGESFDL